MLLLWGAFQPIGSSLIRVELGPFPSLQNSTILVQSSTSLMGKTSSPLRFLKEQDEIMLLWNVFWRGFEIQPISFYLKQCAVCLQFNKHTLARIVLLFPSLFSWPGYPSIIPAFHRKLKVIPKVICLSSGTCRFSPKAIELAKPRGWRLSMDVPWAYSSSDTRAGRASIPSTQVIPATALTVTELGPSTPTVLIGESHLLDRLRSYPASLNAK